MKKLPIKLLIVEDHEHLRKTLKSMLSLFDELDVVGDVEDGIYVDDFLTKNEVDVILMDIQMKIQGGLETTQQVTNKYNNIKVIAYSTHSEDSMKEVMFRAGASRYLVKGEEPDVILKTILDLVEK